ncbi:MAG: hypothetical protein AAF465_13430 [Pseudomonadota bacterium]
MKITAESGKYPPNPWSSWVLVHISRTNLKRRPSRVYLVSLFDHTSVFLERTTRPICRRVSWLLPQVSRNSKKRDDFRGTVFVNNEDCFSWKSGLKPLKKKNSPA